MRGPPRDGNRPRRAGALAALALLALAYVLAPVAVADPGHDHGEEHGSGGGGGFVSPPAQGTAPQGALPSYYTRYQSAWLYGSSTVNVIGSHYIRHLHGDAEWLTWIDGRRNDVYAYNVPAGDGFYVTEDSVQQYRPRVDGNVVVWEDRRNGPADVYAYFLETGETRRLSRGAADNEQYPSFDYPYVAWESDAGEDWDVVVHDLQTGAEVVVSESGARDSEPLVVGSLVVWRTYRFNVWDLMWFDMETGERGSVTSDRAMELAAFSNGEHALYLKESEAGWEMNRFDPDERRSTRTGVTFQRGTEPAASGEYVVQARFDGPSATLVAHNLTNTHSAVVSGFVPLTDLPVLVGRTLYAPVWNGSHNAILAFEVNPYAFRKPPRLTLDTPEDKETLRGPTRVKGKLVYPDGWGEPDLFGYSVNGANFTAVPAAPEWSFLLDLQFARPGTYVLSVEAHFQNAPPVTEEINVVVPGRMRGVDVEQQGRAYQFALFNYHYQRWIGQNLAIIGLAVLVLVLVALWAARWWLRSHAVRRSAIEFVRPDPDAPEDPVAERLRPEPFRTPWSGGDDG